MPKYLERVLTIKVLRIFPRSILTTTRSSIRLSRPCRILHYRKLMHWNIPCSLHYPSTSMSSQAPGLPGSTTWKVSARFSLLLPRFPLLLWFARLFKASSSCKINQRLFASSNVARFHFPWILPTKALMSPILLVRWRRILATPLNPLCTLRKVSPALTEPRHRVACTLT